MEIKRLLPSHAEQYRSLMLRGYENHPQAFSSSVSERSAEPMSWWQSRLAPGPQASQMVIGAFVRHRLVGVSGISFDGRDKTRHKANIFGMYVDDAERGSGIARQLLLATIECARLRKTISIIQLTVSEGNDVAQRLYKESGDFSVYGVEPFAIRVGDTYISKVHMWRKIESMP